MRKYLLAGVAMLSMLVLAACGKEAEVSVTAVDNVETENVAETTTEVESTASLITETIAATKSAMESEVETMAQGIIYVTVNGSTLSAKLEDNSSADALIEKLGEGNITVEMSDYANFEKVGSLGFGLPRNDEQYTTKAGDIILYQGSSIVFYYDTNSWNFTKLGEFQNVTQDELKNIFGSGNITATISLSK